VSGIVPVARLQWSEPAEPNAQCHYTHCTAQTPFGRFLVTWKGWKEHDCPTIDETPWGEFGGAYFDLDEAKAEAEKMYAQRLMDACSQSLKQEPAP
jgi:hypothetical protein